MEQRPTEHLKDFKQQYEYKQGCADIAKGDIGGGVACIIIEVYECYA